MKNLCTFSECRRYRYSLQHRFDDQPIGIAKRILFILLNPSIAAETVSDPTFTRVAGFARREGASIVEIANLFAWVATQPADMFNATSPIGPENNAHLLISASAADVIICGWGTDGDYGHRSRDVLGLLSGYPLHCLGTNKDGSPKHPLYLSASTPLIPYLKKAA